MWVLTVTDKTGLRIREMRDQKAATLWNHVDDLVRSDNDIQHISFVLTDGHTIELKEEPS